MNRTDRLYALVEELRACEPRRRSARELASLYEVSARTIERDVGALQEAGVPIYADAGRSGGYTVDKSLTLPPLNFTPAEAVAVAVALARPPGPNGTEMPNTAAAPDAAFCSAWASARSPAASSMPAAASARAGPASGRRTSAITWWSPLMELTGDRAALLASRPGDEYSHLPVSFGSGHRVGRACASGPGRWRAGSGARTIKPRRSSCLIYLVIVDWSTPHSSASSPGLIAAAERAAERAQHIQLG